MNPCDRNSSAQRLQTHLEPKHLSGLNNKMLNSSRINSNWGIYREYSRCSVVEPRSSGSMSRRKPAPSPHNCHNLDIDDPNGEPLVMDEEDPELSRKKRELEEIEEMIIHKKAAIAVKTVEMFAKKTKSPGDQESDVCQGKTLRDRVKELLQQRHPLTFSSQIQSPKEGLKLSTLRKDGWLQEHHPLKLRVRAAMKHRLGDPCVLPTSGEVSDAPLPPPTPPVKEENGTKKGFDLFLRVLNKGADANLKNVVPGVAQPPPSQSVSAAAKKDDTSNQGFERFLQALNRGADTVLNDMVPDVPVLPPSQSATSPVKENDSVDDGFERFLKVLNKGVDIQLLSRIINDNGESERTKSDPPPGSRSQGSDSEVSLPSCSRTTSTESRTELLSRKPSIPVAEERKSKRDQNVESNRRSASAMSDKKKEGEEMPKADQKHEQLQSIVKTLGLNLDVEELKRLTDRTQVRLYGKRNEGSQRTDSRGEKESEQRHCHRHHSKSCSSSSSSSLCSPISRSSSRSLSRSPHHQRSHREGSKEKRQPKHSHSHEWRTGDLIYLVGDEVRREAEERHCQGETYRPPHPAASIPPDYSLAQHSHYTGGYSAASRDATNSYCSLNQNYSNPLPVSPYQHSYQHPDSVDSLLSHEQTYPHPMHQDLEDPVLHLNPDLSVSEGQSGIASGLRCLKVVNTEQSPPERHLLQLTKGQGHRGRQKRYKKKRPKHRFKRKRTSPGKQGVHSTQACRMEASETVTSNMVALQGDEDDLQAGESEEKKLQPTEEEIKANLREKLHAFNQKAKQAKQLHNSEVMHPLNFLTSELS